MGAVRIIMRYSYLQVLQLRKALPLQRVGVLPKAARPEPRRLRLRRRRRARPLEPVRHSTAVAAVVQLGRRGLVLLRRERAEVPGLLELVELGRRRHAVVLDRLELGHGGGVLLLGKRAQLHRLLQLLHLGLHGVSVSKVSKFSSTRSTTC
jgi:hypothetical protein